MHGPHIRVSLLSKMRRVGSTLIDMGKSHLEVLDTQRLSPIIMDRQESNHLMERGFSSMKVANLLQTSDSRRERWNKI